MTTSIRSYSELFRLKTYEERFRYLELNGKVSEETFGFDRYFNQIFYTSEEWRSARRSVIIRDRGCDLGCDGYDIFSYAIVHHMNPITLDQILRRDKSLFDPEYLITTSRRSHNAIHYGDETLLITKPTERNPGDTKLW